MVLEYKGLEVNNPDNFPRISGNVPRMNDDSVETASSVFAPGKR
jgi:hypothetical protein